MNPNVRWAYRQVAAWAVIGGVRTPIVGCQVDFELNAIPRASVRLPLGRSPTTNAPSPIHGIVQKLIEQTPIQIWCNLSNYDASDSSISDLNIPEGPFLLFDGLTAGGGYVRNNQGVAQYMLTCNHKLVRMNQASVFSDSSHPGNPSRYSYGAVMLDSSDAGGANPVGIGYGGADWTTYSQASKYITPDTIRADLWGQALYPWFKALTAKDGMWVIERNLQSDKSNTQAARGLALLQPGKNWYYTPLKLRSTFAVDVDIANEISKDIAGLTSSPETLGHQTLWDVLVAQFAPEYLFAVVPRVSDALVIPYVPCNRNGGHPFAKIRASEYSGIQLEAASRRPLRAYGILSSIESPAGGELKTDEAASALMGVGGWYDTKKDGAVMIQSGPRWMGSIIAPSTTAPESTGGNLKPVGNALHPGKGKRTHARAKAKVRAEKVQKPLLNAYAQARYAQEVLQGRYGIITGLFRVDIAPGSLVEVEGAGEAFIASDDQFGQPFYGEVLRVSLMVDAETPAAGAAFHIGYTRTAAENEDDRTSVDGHPLYEQSFSGCPLLDP